MGERYWSPRETARFLFEKLKEDWNKLDSFMTTVSQDPGFLHNIQLPDEQLGALTLTKAFGIPPYNLSPQTQADFREKFQQTFGIQIENGEEKLLEQLGRLVRPFALLRKSAELSRKTFSPVRSQRVAAQRELQELRAFRLPISPSDH